MFQSIIPAVDWFFSHDGVDPADPPVVHRLAAWGMTEDGDVIGLISAFSKEPGSNLPRAARLNAVPPVPGWYKHASDLTQAELEAIVATKNWHERRTRARQRAGISEKIQTMNMNEEPTKEQLQTLLASQDDDDGHHVVWVDESGKVHISVIPENSSPIDFQLSTPTMRLRYETLCIGNGFVGPQAAEDDLWVSNLFQALVSNWQTAKDAGRCLTVV
jgi:hypothetical protein